MEPSGRHPHPESPGACPLCGGQRATRLERIRIADLDAEYQRQFGVSVSREFPAGLEALLFLRCEGCGLEFFDPVVAGSAGFYAELSRSQKYYSTTRWEFRETLQRLPAEPDLVDIGCGDGFFLSLLGGTRKRGLELNPEAVQRARARGLDVREGLLPILPAASADVLTLFQVLEHVPRPVEVLADAVRVLRPGGRLFVAVPNNDALIGQALHDPLNAPPHHTLRWRAAAMRHVPKVVPLDLEELLIEPLAPEHMHPYRRTQFLLAVGRLFGRRLPLYRVSAGMTCLRRVANVWTAMMLKVAPGVPKTPNAGFSLLAVYRKR